MLSQFAWSPTAKNYLQAYKLVKKGLEILYKSRFTDGRGISLIAHGCLTESSILQAFPEIQISLLPNIVQLCEENLCENPCFFEGLLFAIALRGYGLSGKVSEKNCDGDKKTLMCIENLIHFIQKAEPNRIPPEDPFKFDKNYSSWLHVLYHYMGSLYTIADASFQAVVAFENSLKCCPSYYDSKRGLGYNFLTYYNSKIQKAKNVKCRQDVQDVLAEFLPHKEGPNEGQTSIFHSWAAEELKESAVKVLQEYLVEAPRCDKSYPNACYYLANFAFLDGNMNEFRKYYELGQDVEEKRLPFFNPVNLPIKDLMSPFYQLFANVKQPVRCGNKACIKKVKESDLKSCGRCGNQKYCSK